MTLKTLAVLGVLFLGVIIITFTTFIWYTNSGGWYPVLAMVTGSLLLGVFIAWLTKKWA